MTDGSPTKATSPVVAPAMCASTLKTRACQSSSLKTTREAPETRYSRLPSNLPQKLKKPEEFILLHYTPGGEEHGIEFSEVWLHKQGIEHARPGVALYKEGPDKNLLAAFVPVTRAEVEELIGEPLEC